MSADSPNTQRRALISGALGAAVGAAVAFPVTQVWSSSTASSLGALVRAPCGTFSGIKQQGMSIFKGIRYGIDTAAYRFKAPVAASISIEVVKAWREAPVCPQRGLSGLSGFPQSEDCLFLNIWTPNADSRAKQAVMVYIHGGAYSSGSGNDPLTDGAALAASGGVVVVTITHRLNAFGYLSLARLDSRFPDSGNVGQLDLILALKWVRDNISAFGGDPGNVTLFGQSGGGAKIATLMAMPAATGLFHKAATMSGQQVTASGPLNAAKRARTYLARVGIDPSTASPQRLVDALEVVDPIIGGSLYFGPVLDDRSLQRHPFYPDAHPLGLQIPMMLGNTIAETAAFFPPHHATRRGLDWLNLADRITPELRVDISPELVVSKYRQWFPEKSVFEVFIAATTAARSWRGQIIEAEARSHSGSPAFVYQLDFEQAAHTADIGLVFGSTPTMTNAQQAMSQRMMDAFIAFAKTGNPGWPHYTLDDRKTMLFDKVSRVESNPRSRERELFATVPYIQPGS